ncbi:MAG: hypothetical protein ACREPI_08170 [Candidatus Dormibacterales bacterium]
MNPKTPRAWSQGVGWLLLGGLGSWGALAALIAGYLHGASRRGGGILADLGLLLLTFAAMSFSSMWFRHVPAMSASRWAVPKGAARVGGIGIVLVAIGVGLALVLPSP